MPSMRDGLQLKLLAKPLLFPAKLQSPPLFPRSVVSVGKVSAANGSDRNRTPFDRTVMAAPSYAPIRVGSCSCSARLPFNVASQPTVASRGNRSTWGLEAVALQPVQLDPHLGFQEPCTPSFPNPNRQTTRWRQSFSLPAGCALASMMLEVAPTPCNRTGFHMSRSSL